MGGSVNESLSAADRDGQERILVVPAGKRRQALGFGTMISHQCPITISSLIVWLPLDSIV